MNSYLDDLLPVIDAEENSHDGIQLNLHERNIHIIDAKDVDVQKGFILHRKNWKIKYTT